MALIAWRTVRGRLPGLVGAFAGVLLGVVLTTVWGVYFESSLRMKALPERFAAADVVVDGDPWVKEKQPGGRSIQAVLPEERPLPQGLADQVRRVPGVLGVVEDRPLYAQLVGVDGVAVGGPNGGPSRGHAWSAASTTPFRLVSGQPPRRDGDVVVDRRTAARTELEPGSTVRVLTVSGARTYRVVGFVEPAGSPGRRGERPREASLFFTDREAAELSRSAGVLPGPSAIAVTTRPGVSPRQLALRIEERVGAAGVRVLHGGDRAEAENRETVAGRDFALAISASFGLLAAVFTMVIVSGPFSISVQQRRREIALLRAVGASRGTVRGMVCGEALILASVGTLLGGPLGLLLAEPMREVLVSAGILPAQLSLSRSLLPLLAAAILSLIGVQAAALMAVRRASRIRPVEALREADAPPQGVSGWRTLGGVLVLVVGVVLTLRNQSEGDVIRTLAYVAVLLLGFALLGPVVVRLGMGLIGSAMTRVGGIAGHLTHRAFRAETRRLAGAVVPLTLVSGFACTVLFTGTTLERESAQQATARLTEVDRVLVANGADGLPPGIADRARDFPGVRAVAPMVSTRFVVRRKSPIGDVLETVSAKGLQPDATAATLDLAVRDGRLTDLRGNSVAISTNLAHRLGWRLGEHVPIVLGDGNAVRLRVVASFDRSDGFADLLVPRDLALRHVTLGLDTEVYLAARTSDGLASVDALLSRVRTDFPTVRVLERHQAVARVEAVSAADSRSRYLLLGTLLAFSAAATATALTMAAVQRKKDLMLLRTLGADRRLLARIVVWEWIAVSGLALLAGAAAASLPLATFSHGLTGSALPSLPVPLLGGTAVGIALLALVANLVPVALALRTPPLNKAV